MHCFFYGSLMDRELLALVIGPVADELRIAPAAIHDFVRRQALNESFPVLVPRPGGRVQGILVTDLTATDIARLKFYEGSEYALTELPVECRGGRLLAQVFLPTAHIAADEAIWEFDTWAAAERPLFMAMVKELMSRYGHITAAENNELWPQLKVEVERRFRRRQHSGTDS